MAVALDAPKLTAPDLKRAIAARYEAPEWLVESEVTLGGRRLDVVAFAMWNARQYRVVGFEIKVDRGDWLRELAAFQKSEQWTEVVDAFYVVTPPKLVKPDELPLGWGLLELTGSRMMTRAHPQAKTPGATLPRELTARLLSRMQERSRSADRTAAAEDRMKLRQEIQSDIERRWEADRKHLLGENERLAKELRELHQAFGCEPREWRAQEIALSAAGTLARVGMDNAPQVLLRQAETVAADLRQKLATVERLRAEFTRPSAE